jgi:hypothetical protein
VLLVVVEKMVVLAAEMVRLMELLLRVLLMELVLLALDRALPLVNLESQEKHYTPAVAAAEAVAMVLVTEIELAAVLAAVAEAEKNSEQAQMAQPILVVAAVVAVWPLLEKAALELLLLEMQDEVEIWVKLILQEDDVLQILSLVEVI